MKTAGEWLDKYPFTLGNCTGDTIEAIQRDAQLSALREAGGLIAEARMRRMPIQCAINQRIQELEANHSGIPKSSQGGGE